ncbi:hypothetical protein [Methyloversatilis sp.]|uniref:hypothetical protein n=1 Tax=Methyloversatilis sp. TaxID=2569862 RepID=UPI0027BADE09|nr:hypothetical protein [Methyloversatilis sp.]
MNRIWAALALSALSCTTAWADAASGHAGSAHPADALKDKAPANVGSKPALPPGVTPSTRKVHAGQEHPVIEGHDHVPQSATEQKLAMPIGVQPSQRKVHAGQEHPVIESHDHVQPSATELKPALPPGVKR